MEASNIKFCEFHRSDHMNCIALMGIYWEYSRYRVDIIRIFMNIYNGNIVDIEWI